MNIIAIKSVIDALRSGVDPLLNPKGIITNVYVSRYNTSFGELIGGARENYILGWLDMGESQYEVFLWLMEITLAKGSQYCADFFEGYYRPQLENYEAQKVTSAIAKEAFRKMLDRQYEAMLLKINGVPKDELKLFVAKSRPSGRAIPTSGKPVSGKPVLMDFQEKLLKGIITSRQGRPQE